MERGQGGTITIRLDEQSRKFAYDKKRMIRGEIRIQTGAEQSQITVRAENLNNSGTKYKLFFIGRKGGTSVYKIIGDITPDKRGTVQFKALIDPANVDGEGTDLSCFYIFMIAAAETPLQPVLKGDLGNRNSELANNKKTYNNYYFEYIKQMCANLIAKADRYTAISPFDDMWLADNWKRVTDVMELPVASIGAGDQIRKYGHFIFAVNDERFLLAVPGKHTDEDWPDRGASGFMMWQPIRNSHEYGYWCMVIDWKTGIITEIS